MRDLKKVIKRDYKLYLAELLICIVMAIVACADVGASLLFDNSNYHTVYANIIYFVQTLYMIILEWFVPAMMFCTFVYWVVFDDKGQKLFKASLPISNWQESKYDLISGWFICLVASIVVIMLGACDYYIWCNVYGASFAVDMGLLLLVNVIKFLAIGMCANTLMVIGKRVASSIRGTLVFIVVFGGFLTYLEMVIEYNIVDGLFEHHINLESIPHNIAILIEYLFILALLLIALVVVNKKIDIAKGGTYYFKSVQITICVLVTVFIIYTAEIEKVMRLSVIYGIGVIVLALMTGGGIYYITNSKK